MIKTKIYESPDGGKTVFEREFGAPASTRKQITVEITDEGPFKSALDHLSTQGVVSHSLVTYVYKSSILTKQTMTRKYTRDGDYTDSFTSEPIGRGSAV